MSPVRLLALLLATWPLLCGCLAAPSEADWLAVGFQTPEQTFRTFQTGLRAGDPDLEYRCLAGAFKRRMQVGQMGYREYRRELFRGSPWLKLAARARIQERIVLAPDRVRLVAEVSTWFHDETFVVEFVREDFYELWVDGERVDDDAVAWEELARAENGALLVRIPLGELDWRDVGQLVAGHEWKIDGFPGQTPEETSGPQPRP